MTADMAQEEEGDQVPEDDDDDEGREAGNDGDEPKEGSKKPRKTHHDQDGVYYFGDPSVINELLAVDVYHRAMPTIPLV